MIEMLDESYRMLCCSKCKGKAIQPMEEFAIFLLSNFLKCAELQDFYDIYIEYVVRYKDKIRSKPDHQLSEHYTLKPLVKDSHFSTVELTILETISSRYQSDSSIMWIFASN